MLTLYHSIIPRKQAQAQRQKEGNGMDELYSNCWADIPYCVGCRFYRALSNHGHHPGKACHYLLDIGHSRGCKAGEGCTQRIIEIKAERAERLKQEWIREKRSAAIPR